MLAHCFFPLKLEISRKCESEQIELDNKNASKKKEKVEDEKINWSTCVEVLQRFRYSAAAAAVHLSNLTTSTTGQQTHIMTHGER
jgi:hypothetical protein